MTRRSTVRSRCTRWRVRRSSRSRMPGSTRASPRANTSRDNANVTGMPNLVFFAAAPLITPGGVPIGTIAVADDKPHTLTRTSAPAARDRRRGDGSVRTAPPHLGRPDRSERAIADALGRDGSDRRSRRDLAHRSDRRRPGPSDLREPSLPAHQGRDARRRHRHERAPVRRSEDRHGRAPQDARNALPRRSRRAPSTSPTGSTARTITLRPRRNRWSIRTARPTATC